VDANLTVGGWYLGIEGYSELGTSTELGQGPPLPAGFFVRLAAGGPRLAEQPGHEALVRECFERVHRETALLTHELDCVGR
jgi:hypothetical protein